MPTDRVAASVFVQAPPERVYEYFTRPEAIVRWMGEYALLEPQPDGRFTLDVRGAPVRGRYLELEPPHRLLISWGYAGSERLAPGASTVEVRLIAEPGGNARRTRAPRSPRGRDPRTRQRLDSLPCSPSSNSGER
jgi:uncharacterized protein YndB with AHSA1/START domain